MADLLLFNSWWENPGSIELDRYISAFQQSFIQWRPDILGGFEKIVRCNVYIAVFLDVATAHLGVTEDF